MQHHNLVCWKCGASLAELPLPLGRLAECPRCRAYLHACLLCRFYDKRVAKQCCEDDADEVIEKERANFCEYFSPRADAYRAAEHAKSQSARGDLDALFGAPRPESAPADEARRKLDDLFGSGRDD